MEENLITMVMPMLMQKFTQEKNTNSSLDTPLPNQNVINETPTPVVDFSQEQIKSVVNSNPNLKNMGKQFTDEELTKYLKTQIKGISESSIDAIIQEVRN